MKVLTAESSAADAWARMFEPSDIVALKVNPSGTHPTLTPMALVRGVIRSLNAIGVPNRNLIVSFSCPIAQGPRESKSSFGSFPVALM